MIALDSSAIAAVDYDATAGILVVRFHTGRTYSHPGVPYTVFIELIQSSSPGRYYNSHIRGTYR